MQTRKRYATFFCMFYMLCMLLMSTSVFCNDLDTMNQNGSSTTDSSSSGTGDESFDSITDYMRGYESVTSEDMQKASKMTGPVARLIGTASGVVIMLTTAFLFFTTALDLMCIAVPFTRKWLYPESLAQQGAGGASPGMGMGMMGMGRMGMGMGGVQQGAQPTGRRLVSDECVAALAEAQPQQQQGATGGMGMGMGAMPAQQAPMSTKSVIATYFKKRIFFVIVFAIASTILMSSLLMDCGLNLAELLYKIGVMFNDGLAGVNM